MSNLFGIFFVLYMLILIVHGSIYSYVMQSISRLKTSSKERGANRKAIREQINGKLTKVKWMRRISWIIYLGLFMIHLKFISKIRFPEDDVKTNAIYLFVGVSVLLFLMNWLKGRGLVDEKVRFKGRKS